MEMKIYFVRWKVFDFCFVLFFVYVFAVKKLTTNGEVQSEAILRLTLSFKQQVKV